MKLLKCPSYVGSVEHIPFKDQCFDAVCIDLPHLSSGKPSDYVSRFYRGSSVDQYRALARKAIKESSAERRWLAYIRDYGLQGGEAIKIVAR